MSAHAVTQAGRSTGVGGMNEHRAAPTGRPPNYWNISAPNRHTLYSQCLLELKSVTSLILLGMIFNLPFVNNVQRLKVNIDRLHTAWEFMKENKAREPYIKISRLCISSMLIFKNKWYELKFGIGSLKLCLQHRQLFPRNSKPFFNHNI